jgi:hypothetical protein
MVVEGQQLIRSGGPPPILFELFRRQVISHGIFPAGALTCLYWFRLYLSMMPRLA